MDCDVKWKDDCDVKWKDGWKLKDYTGATHPSIIIISNSHV